MIAPIWMASPPEVHSALLSSGPGPGPLLAAAAAWHGLSAEYAAAATELTSNVAGVQAGAWQGLSADQYAAAHAPYLAWLTQQSAASAATAAAHETVAAAYTTALATMPTLVELALNHATHTVLVWTNFFGINTIPIALNEADYVRMWIQAATSMATYQAMSSGALAALPVEAPSPLLLKPGVGEAGQALADATQAPATAQATEAGDAVNNSDWLSELLRQYIDTLPGGDEIWKFLQDPLGTLQQILTDFLTNPGAALVTWFPLLFAIGYQAFWQPVGWTSWALILSSPILIPLLIGIAVQGADMLNPAQPEPAAAEPEPEPAPSTTIIPRDQGTWHLAAVPAAVPAPGVAPTPAPAPGAPAAPTSPVPAAAEGLGYAVRGGYPDEWVGPTLTDKTGAKAPAADIPAAAAAGAVAMAADKRRARRRRGAAVKDRGYRDEFMDMDSGFDEPPADKPEPSTVTASQRGAGGFAGTTGKKRAAAGGLTTLAGDAFGNGPAMPMMPSTWELDSESENPTNREENDEPS